MHTASFIILIEHGQLDIGLEWRIQRFGTYLEATVLATISPVEGVTLHQEYAGTFTLHRHGDYEARYTGTYFTLDAQEPITMEASGRLQSGVTEDEAPGLVLKSTIPVNVPEFLPDVFTLYDFISDPENDGTPRAADGPGFHYCGGSGSCRCKREQGDTGFTTNACPTYTKNECPGKICRVNPGDQVRQCYWDGCASGVGAPLAGSILGFAGIGLRSRLRGRAGKQSRARRCSLY